MWRIYMPSSYAVSVRLVPVQGSFGLSTRWINVASQVLLFPSLAASLFSWRFLAASTSYSFTWPLTSVHPPSQTTPLPSTPSLSSPPICSTPGCRSVRNRFTLSLSRLVLSALHPQDFRTCFASATARRSFGWAAPPTNVFSYAMFLQCSNTGLSWRHGRTRSSRSLISWAVPRQREPRLCGVRCGIGSSVLSEVPTFYIHTVGPRLPRPLPFGFWGGVPLSAGRRAHVGTTGCASSMRGFRSRRPPGRWRITPVCRSTELLRLVPSFTVYAIEACTWCLSPLPTRSKWRLGNPQRWLPSSYRVPAANAELSRCHPHPAYGTPQDERSR